MLEDGEICRIAQHIVSASMAPAVSICVATNRSNGWHFKHGTAGQVNTKLRLSVTPDTLFDLASLTKPCVALTAAMLGNSSRISLTTPIRTYLPELEGFPVAHATLEHLLSHRAGLKPHIDLFAGSQRMDCTNKGAMLRQIARHGNSPDRDVLGYYQGKAVYSDLGYLLAGAVMERHLSLPLDQIVAGVLCTRLDLPIASSRHWRAELPAFTKIVAPTEYVRWRGGIVLGQVHDENAWAFAGYGLAGHAGLFGSARGVAQLGCAVLDSIMGRSSLIDPFSAHYCTAWRNGGTFRAGFDGKSVNNSTAGSRLSVCSFGHLGFTGTSLWCDPSQDLVIALLSNRICPTRRNTRLVSARGALHDCLAMAATSEESLRNR